MFNIFKKKLKKRRLVDLYYVLSRAMYFDLEKKQLVSNREAMEIFSRRHELKHVGVTSSSNVITADIFNNGNPRVISGFIYEL